MEVCDYTDNDKGFTDFSGFLEGGDGRAPGADGLLDAQALPSATH